MLRRFPNLPILTFRTVLFAVIFGRIVGSSLGGDSQAANTTTAPMLFPERAAAAQTARDCAAIYTSGTPKQFPSFCLPIGTETLASWAGPIISGVSSDPDHVRPLSKERAVATVRLISEDAESMRFIYMSIHLARDGGRIKVAEDGYSLEVGPTEPVITSQELLSGRKLDETLSANADVRTFLSEVMDCYAKSNPCLLDKNPTAKPGDGQGLDGIVTLAEIVTSSSQASTQGYSLKVTEGDKHCARVPVLWQGIPQPQVYYIPFDQASNGRYYLLDKPRTDAVQCLKLTADQLPANQEIEHEPVR